jgi:biotin synthase-like enzyme
MPDPSPIEVEIAIRKFKKYKFQELIKFRQNGFKEEVKYCSMRSGMSLNIKAGRLIHPKTIIFCNVTQ